MLEVRNFQTSQISCPYCLLRVAWLGCMVRQQINTALLAGMKLRASQFLAQSALAEPSGGGRNNAQFPKVISPLHLLRLLLTNNLEHLS
jgi:hypothetical protein